MSSTPDSAAPVAPKKTSSASRYLFLFLLGLVIGAIAVVMILRSIDSRKTWKDHYPDSVMHVMEAHMAQLEESTAANRCGATDVLPHLKALREMANDIEPAFGDLRDDTRFGKHASDLRATLDGTLASPPLNCAGVGAMSKKIGENCKACHQDFRG